MWFFTKLNSSLWYLTVHVLDINYSFVGYCGFRWGQCNFSAIYVPAINSRLYEKYVEQYYPGMVLPLASQKYFDNMIIFLMVCKCLNSWSTTLKLFPQKYTIPAFSIIQCPLEEGL